MSKHANKEKELEPEVEQEQDPNADREDALRRLLDEQGDNDTFNPRTGEDPGALPLTEDPNERRMKRTTM